MKENWIGEHRVTLNLSAELDAILRIFAESMALSMSGLMRMALISFVMTLIARQGKDVILPQDVLKRIESLNE